MKHWTAYACRCPITPHSGSAPGATPSHDVRTHGQPRPRRRGLCLGGPAGVKPPGHLRSGWGGV
eukprot:6685158-Prymnesium_polylepis.2